MLVLTVHADVWEPEQEARGRHPAAGRAGAAALLSALLGALPQHPAHPAALQAGPGRVQVRWAGQGHVTPGGPAQPVLLSLWVSSLLMGAWSGDSPPQQAAPAVASRGQTTAHFN